MTGAAKRRVGKKREKLGASQTRAACPQNWWGFTKISRPARGSATTIISARGPHLLTPVPIATKVACVALDNILHTNAPMYRSHDYVDEDIRPPKILASLGSYTVLMLSAQDLAPLQ